MTIFQKLVIKGLCLIITILMHLLKISDVTDEVHSSIVGITNDYVKDGMKALIN